MRFEDEGFDEHLKNTGRLRNRHNRDPRDSFKHRLFKRLGAYKSLITAYKSLITRFSSILVQGYRQFHSRLPEEPWFREVVSARGTLPQASDVVASQVAQVRLIGSVHHLRESDMDIP